MDEQVQKLFEKVRHYLAPFGWDVELETPAVIGGAWVIRAGMVVRAAGHKLEGQRLGVQWAVGRMTMYLLAGDLLEKTEPQRIAYEMTHMALELLGKSA